MNKKLKIKVKALGILDLLRFKNLVPNRRKHFENAPSTPLVMVPYMNELANAIHPKEQNFEIVEVINVT
ncbi:MAG: hypothetical protein WCR54_03305 [Clostridia bacterium]